MEDDNLEEARTAYSQAIEANETPEWKVFRASLRSRLANVLISQERFNEAKEVYSNIPKEDVANWFRKRYEEVGKKLEESAD